VCYFVGWCVRRVFAPAQAAEQHGDNSTVRSGTKNSHGMESPAKGHQHSRPMYLSGMSILAAWLASLGLHALGLVVMFFLVFPFAPKKQLDAPAVRADVIGDFSPTAFAALRPPVEPQTHQEVEMENIRFVPKRVAELSTLTAPQKPKLAIIGIGTGGGDFARYGLTVSADRGPVFFGLGGSEREARHIVYVVDRSGSMLDTFTYVCQELKRSVSGLKRSQKFHVIFFNSGAPLENPPGRLVSAIRAQKEELFDFLDQVFPEGATNPEPAMRRALALEPDLIYFLTDGEFDAGLVDALDRLNHDRRAKIYTIAYFDRRGAELLEKIARAHGGKFRFFSELDLP